MAEDPRIVSLLVGSLLGPLGYSEEVALLIVNCDDLGMCDAANAAVVRSLREGLATTATLMVPCPKAEEAARLTQGLDIGVHLTLTAEWESYRWGPITGGRSLVDAHGFLPRTSEEVWERADPSEVRQECYAQVEQALEWGVDVTHVDSHMGTVQVNPGLFEIYLDTAARFDVPMRLSGPRTESILGFPFRQMAQEKGVVFTDDFVFVPGVGSRQPILDMVPRLPHGVTEAYLHPAEAGEEIRSIAPDWPSRTEDAALLVRGSALDRALEAHDVELIGYRPLRDLMRARGAEERWRG